MGAGQSLHIEADQTLCPAKMIPDAIGEVRTLSIMRTGPADGLGPQLTRSLHVPFQLR